MKIVASIFTFILTATVSLAGTIFAYGFMIIAMNGFPNSKAVEPGIILFTVWAIISGLLTSGLSVLVVILLANKKDLNPFLAGLLSVIIFSIVSLISLAIGVFASLMLVSILWEMR